MENPPVTVHINRKFKESLDKLRGAQSYAQVIREIIEGTFDVEKKIKQLPATEALIYYLRGFKEAKSRYARSDICSNCGINLPLCYDGKCELCHKSDFHPDFRYIDDKEVIGLLQDKDLEKVKLPKLERLSYENGRKRGNEEGYERGYKEAEKEYRITFPCSVCGEEIEIKPVSDIYRMINYYLQKSRWRHVDC